MILHVLRLISRYFEVIIPRFEVHFPLRLKKVARCKAGQLRVRGWLRFLRDPAHALSSRTAADTTYPVRTE